LIKKTRDWLKNEMLCYAAAQGLRGNRHDDDAIYQDDTP
jgi:hypothetical protein